jgi:hypothetical protein
MQATLTEAAEQLEAVAAVTDDAVAVIDEVVADKGYHSRQAVYDLETLDIRTYISEPDRGPHSWIDQEAEREAVYANRRRIRGERGKDWSASAANCWNTRARIFTRLADSAACTCAATKIFSSASSCTPVRAISGCGFGRSRRRHTARLGRSGRNIRRT